MRARSSRLLRALTGAGLALLVAAAVAGLVLTRERTEQQPAEANGRAPRAGSAAPRRERLVDMRPLLLARQLSAFAAGPEEQELAREAERLADHAIDLAFVDAVRDATERTPESTPEVRALAAERARGAAAVEEARREVAERERAVAQGDATARERAASQLEVARAQLELAEDELAAIVANLQRAGGDPQARVRRLREVYEAAQKEPRPPAVGLPAGAEGQSVLARYRAFAWQRERGARLAEARADTLARIERLSKRRATLAGRVESEGALRQAAQRAAERVAKVDASEAARDGALGFLKRFGDPQRRLATMGRRLEDNQELAETYGSWKALVDGQARAALHRLLVGLCWVLAILVAVFLASRLVDRLFRGLGREKARVETLRTVVKLAVRVLGVLVALFVLFGAPAQATTIVGLAGAGLTVALKDFIVAFFGWFVLMGRNGIRVGDWVEIKGVGGEVAEIGLFHTVLLETGSWSDAGHPTGRRVSFVNGFAIEGHYFNFSTGGQWMWDELRVLLPPGKDPFPVIEGVQKLAERETEANARLAEQEWAKATTRYRVRTFSAVPGLNVVPTAAGIEINVRYITRAHERHETRRRLYHSVLELLHGKRPEPEPVAS